MLRNDFTSSLFTHMFQPQKNGLDFIITEAEMKEVFHVTTKQTSGVCSPRVTGISNCKVCAEVLIVKTLTYSSSIHVTSALGDWVWWKDLPSHLVTNPFLIFPSRLPKSELDTRGWPSTYQVMSFFKSPVVKEKEELGNAVLRSPVCLSLSARLL